MAGITTSDFFVPKFYVPTIVEKIAQNSVIATLTTSKPQLYTDESHVIMNTKPLAQYVGEGEAKGSTKPGLTEVKKKIFKLQTTVRLSDESKWADEDSQTYYLDQIFDTMTESIAQGIDYGMIHGWNPAGAGTTTNLLEIAIANNATQVTATGNHQADLDSLPDSVIEKLYRVNGVALDPMYANELRKLRIEATGAKVYPELGLTLDPGTLDGLRAVVGESVGGAELGVSTGVKAIMGNWDAIQWGVVRNIGLKPIEYGDPDGNGDLQQKNEIAYRVELVYAVTIIDPKAFAVLKAAA